MSTRDDADGATMGFRSSEDVAECRTEQKELNRLRSLIANDAYAISFQTLGQYRTALLKAIDALKDLP